MFEQDEDFIAQAQRQFRDIGTADDRYILDRILDAQIEDIEGFELDEEGE